MSSASPTVFEQQIALLESHLAQLKKDQTLLHNLTARKQELHLELRRVESQIARVQGKAAALPVPEKPVVAKPAAKPAAAATPAKTPTPAKAAVPSPAAPRLAEIIVACLKDANGKPVSVRQLTEESLKRGFTTTSPSPYKMVESRVQDLSKKGVIARAKNQPGWVIKSAAKAAAPKAAAPAAKSMAVKAAKPTANGVAAAAKNGAAKVVPTLRERIVQLLKQNKRPLSVKDLTGKVLASGHKTASKDFYNVVAVQVKKMKGELKRVPGEGYTVKHGK
jgi:hypothetical protein